MLGLDHNAPFLLVAFGLTVVVLAGYALYLRSRLTAARRAAAQLPLPPSAAADVEAAADYSARTVSAAAPRASTAHAARSANGSTAP